MARRLAVVAIIVVLITSGAFVARVPAQQQQASTQTELLAEVRLLRQAIESLTGVNARVQIVFGRLQLQEQRTTTALKRLDDARKELARVTRESADLTERAKIAENAIAEKQLRPEQLEQLREELAMLKRVLDSMESDRVRLTGEEAEAASALNQEQGRWSDLNRQLEELERALAKR